MATSVGGANASSYGLTNSFANLYNQYAKSLEDQRAKYVNAQNAQRAADEKQVNSSYDNNARQYYIQNMQAQKNLPQELNAQGINGGASESALLRLNTAYGNNLAQNETARASGLSSLAQNYANNMDVYDREQQSDLAAKRLTLMENQRQWEEDQREKDLKYFANSITGRFNSVQQYRNLINQLSASDDPNKEYKIALAQQAMTALLQQQAAASSGGGSGYRRSYGGGGYSSGSGSSSSADIDPSVAAAYNQVANAVLNSAAQVASSPSINVRTRRRTPNVVTNWR